MSSTQQISGDAFSKKRKLEYEDSAAPTQAKKRRERKSRWKKSHPEDQNTDTAMQDATQNAAEVPVGEASRTEVTSQTSKEKKPKKKSLILDVVMEDGDANVEHQPEEARRRVIMAKREQRKRRKAAKREAEEALGPTQRTKTNPHLTKDKFAHIQQWAEQSSSESVKAVAPKPTKRGLKPSHPAPSTSGWTLSSRQAGRFLDVDPIFVQDGDGQEYLVSANDREMQLLSLETSLVVRTLPSPPGRCIRCFAGGTPNDNVIRVAHDNNSVWTWDWMNEEGEEATHTFTAPGPIVAIASTRLPQAKRSTLIYITQTSKKSVIYREGSGSLLFEIRESLESIQIFGEMEYIVAQGPSVIVLGTKNQTEDASLDFVWTQIPLLSKATCAQARLLPVEPTTKKSKPQRPGLCLAVGNEDGQIHLYDDISTVSGRKPQLPSPRILHWHREAVSSVKFSQDGNYLISGGKETVLVLWQLQTSKKQYLPHLTSAIERIVVNPKGDRYAVQMGDNSIMVLNTSELKPVANFAGLQAPSKIGPTSDALSMSAAAALHPQRADQLLLSVPSTQPKSSNDISARPFLQTFDLRTSRHIARQALTRNNVTDFNLGPEGTPIMPPDVKQVSISHDGLWLATVDEWTPPDSDLEHLASHPSEMESLRQSRREVYLKFWKWDEKDGLWTLTTRVDSPHLVNRDSTGSSDVLAVVSNPATNSFASIGEDCRVKIWKPKKRTRSGVPLKDRTDNEIMEWTCKRTIQLPRTQGRTDFPFSSTESKKSATACLSYAGDGSMLAATISTDTTEEAPVVHFINPSTGDSIPKPGLAAHGIVAMAFLDQYFVAVSQPAAYVWDLINDTLMYKTKPKGNNQSQPTLTIDAVGGTFALTTGSGAAGRTKVAVYSPKDPGCLYKHTFDVPIEAVLASNGAKGYTLLFADATIRTLSPATSRPLRALALPELEVGEQLDIEAPAAEQDDDVEAIKSLTAAGNEGIVSRRTVDDEEDDRPVVRPEQLANLFDTPQSFAMPPVQDMFAAVVGLFGRQPYVKPAVEAS